MGAAISPIQIDSRVADFIGKPRKMLIDGKWVTSISGKTFPTYNPATGEVLAQVAEGDKQDVDAAVKAARKAFETGPWSRMQATQRSKLIWKLGDLLEQNVEQFAMLETLDNGKPLAVARAADVPLAADPAFRPLHAQGKVPRLHSARTRGRGGADYSLEFPAIDGSLEARTGARCWKHSDPEAGGADASHRLAARRTDHGGRFPRRRRQHRAWIRRNRWRCPGCA